jgi:hypothetical protein
MDYGNMDEIMQSLNIAYGLNNALVRKIMIRPISVTPEGYDG